MNPRTVGPMDSLHSLRRIDFPYCVHEALKKLDTVVRQDAGRVKASQPFIQALVSEFIIFDSGSTGKHRRALSNIQSLQLLEVLTDYFSLPNSDVARTTAFLALFGAAAGQEAAAGHRALLLTRLVSLAVSTRSRPVLSCAGAWIMQQGCTSVASLRLTEALVEDHLLMEPERTGAASAADQLPELAPQLTACLLTAITHLYSNLSARPPPPSVLRQVLRWLEQVPTLPLVPLSNAGPVAASALAGLWGWTVLSAALPPDQPTAPPAALSRLHLLLMTCLLEVPRLRGQSAGALRPLSVDQLRRLVDALLELGLGRQPADIPPGRLLALDRTAQLVQVALSVDALDAGKRETLQQLTRLRPTRLIQIVLQHNS